MEVKVQLIFELVLLAAILLLFCESIWSYVAGFIYLVLRISLYKSLVERKKHKDTFVVIIGGGFSGLCSAIKLKLKGIDFVIVEKAASIGGTWYYNKYPGCECDVMSHLYSFSFYPNPYWTKSYAGHAEILKYLEDVCKHYDLYSHIKLNTKVEKCIYDSKTKKWTVFTSTGEKILGNFLISATGFLSTPFTPDIKGKDSFVGQQIHTAEWDPHCDVTNKRVGVVGTGCTSIQVVPGIASKVKHLYVFQRTPSWVAPRLEFSYPNFLMKCFALFPVLITIHRWLLYCRHEFLFYQSFTKGSKLGKFAQNRVKSWMYTQLDDEELRTKMTPDYEIGCKRITVSNEYLKSFNRANVELVDKPIVSITQKGISVSESNGLQKEINLDIIIYATGFNILKSLSSMDIYKPNKEIDKPNKESNKAIRDNKQINKMQVDNNTLANIWGNNPNAYLGIMYPKFPNLFILLGPGTGLGHNSVVWIIECQVNYIIDAILKTLEMGKSSIEVQEAVNRKFQDLMKTEMSKRVFGSGCNSWYQNSEGVNFALWPSHCTKYWWKTLWADVHDFIFR